MAELSPRKRVTRDIDTTVAEVIRETPDTVTLVLSTQEPLRDYKAGQFVNIEPQQFRSLGPLIAHLQHLKGRKEHSRAYSLASAPHEDRLAITIKVEPYDPAKDRYPPLLSPHLVYAMHPGDRLRVNGFMGPYVLPEDAPAQATQVLHVVAGSGAVPNFSILKDALQRELPLRHTFVCSNRTAQDIIFRKELDLLHAQHPDRLQVVHLLTRETDAFPYDHQLRRGRVTRELLQSLVPDPNAVLAFVCGPAITSWERRAALEKGEQATPRFLETVLGYLQELGVPPKKVKRESYG